MMRVVTIWAAALGLSILSVAAAAQSAASDFDLRAVLAQATAAPFAVNEEFEAAIGRQIPLHWKMNIPIAEGLMDVRYDASPSDIHPLLEDHLMIFFNTPDGKNIELTNFYTAIVPSAPLAEREEYLVKLITDTLLPSLPNLHELNILATIPSHMGPHPAMEVIATYVDDGAGPMVLRILGGFPPQGERVVIAASYIVLAQVPLTRIRELTGTISYAMLGTFDFTHRRTEEGSLLRLFGSIVRQH